MENKKIGFEEAFAELKSIAEALEKHELPVDKLEAMIKRSSELMKICKSKLRNIEEKLDDIFDEMP